MYKIGQKFKEYETDVAIWCGKNGAYIENKDDYYIIVKDTHQNMSYKDKRLSEYLPIGEQLDMLYHDKINNTNLWEEHITAVKNKYPKK